MASAQSGYYWQSERIRLRPMHEDDMQLWLEEEQSDSGVVRFLRRIRPICAIILCMDATRRMNEVSGIRAIALAQDFRQS